MNKKSYKRLQNRLYREIKARIIAEKELCLPDRFWPVCETRRIDTLRVKRCYSVPANYEERIDAFNKQQLARELTTRLLEDGYIAFRTNAVEYSGCLMAETEAELDVVKPREGIRRDEL